MAATGTPTPNIGLRIPIGTDPASVDDINYNSNLIDTKLGAVGSDSVQDQIDTLNGKIRKTISISGTTDGTGDIALNMYVSDIVPLAIYGQGAKGYVFMCSSDNNKWWVKFINDNLSNAANESVSFTLIYMERQ